MFGNPGLDGFTYRGVTYSYMLDVEPDENCKTLHAAILADGTDTHFDWSPYSNPTREDFILWVDLGMPDRITNGPLDRKDLDQILKNRAMHPTEAMEMEIINLRKALDYREGSNTQKDYVAAADKARGYR